MSSVSVNSPKTPVTEGSNGVAAATLPNVCKMPGPPAPFVPTPLPNIGKSGQDPKNHSKSVTIEGKRVAIRGATFGSMGDVASKGTGGGLVSSNVEGPTSFVGPGSMDVKIEGKNVHLLGDPMLNNCGPSGSPANSATLMGVIQKTGFVTYVTGKDRCPLCHNQHGKITLKESASTKKSAEQLAEKVARRVHGEKVAAVKRGDKRSKKLQTMLGVVQCACGREKKYVDNSSMTHWSVCEAAKELEWVAPESPDIMYDRKTKNNKKQEKLNKDDMKTVRGYLESVFGAHPGGNFKKFWEKLEDLSDKSMRGETPSAAYPPGSCAGPKALLLALNGEAYPGALTERFYHSENQLTSAAIAYRDEKGAEKKEPFGPGKSVPPCLTCNVIVPAMLCPTGRAEEMKCRHQR